MTGLNVLRNEWAMFSFNKLGIFVLYPNFMNKVLRNYKKNMLDEQSHLYFIYDYRTEKERILFPFDVAF